MDININKQKKYPELDENRFYKEVDEKRSHNSCCTCQTMLIFFVIIFIITIFGVYYFYKQITNSNIKFNLPDITASFDEVKNKFSKMDFSGKDISLPVSEEELSVLIKDGFNLESLSLKDLQTTINPESIIIYGDLIKPINSKIAMETIPEIIDNRIYFRVDSIKAGKLNLPKFIADRYAESLSENLAQKISVIYNNFTVEEVILQDKKMLIKGKKK